MHWLSNIKKFVERNFDIKHVDKLADYQRTVEPKRRYKIAFNLAQAEVYEQQCPIAYEVGLKLQILKYFRDEIR